LGLKLGKELKESHTNMAILVWNFFELLSQLAPDTRPLRLLKWFTILKEVGTSKVRVLSSAIGRTVLLSLCLSQLLLTVVFFVPFLEQPQLPKRQTAAQLFGNPRLLLGGNPNFFLMIPNLFFFCGSFGNPPKKRGLHCCRVLCTFSSTISMGKKPKTEVGNEDGEGVKKSPEQICPYFFGILELLPQLALHTVASREIETTVFDPASQFLSNISRLV